jgi:hypothetical protein
MPCRQRQDFLGWGRLKRRSGTHSLPFMKMPSARNAHGHVIRIDAQNHRAVAALQIHPRPVHAAIEAVQDESSSGKGTLEASRTGTAVGCGGCDSAQEVREARLAASAAFSE